MNFRKFTLERDENPVWVDIDKIAYFRKSKAGDGTTLVFTGDLNQSVAILETVDDVVSSIGIEIV